MPGAGRGDHRLPGGNAARSRPHAFRGPPCFLPLVPGVCRADETARPAQWKGEHQVTRARDSRLAVERVPPLARFTDSAVTSGAGPGLHLNPTRDQHVNTEAWAP